MSKTVTIAKIAFGICIGSAIGLQYIGRDYINHCSPSNAEQRDKQIDTIGTISFDGSVRNYHTYVRSILESMNKTANYLPKFRGSCNTFSAPHPLLCHLWFGIRLPNDTVYGVFTTKIKVNECDEPLRSWNFGVLS